MYDNVLVPTDGSEAVEQALEHAAAVADRFDATIHVLHVVQRPDAAAELAELDSIVDRLERAGSDAVDTATEELRENGHDDVTAAVVRGVPNEEIRAYVAEQDIDVVVMSTAGRTGTAREMIGSVTEAVVRDSAVPVLTVNVGD